MYTRGVIVLFYDWCIESKNEYLLQEWNYEKNQSVSSHTEHTTSKTKVWWKCLLCGHEWETAICYRHKGSGCPKCAKKKVSVSRKTPSPGQSLEDTFPNVAKEWHSTKNGTLLPSDVSGKSHQKVWWLGECGHEWEAIVSSRTNGSGCPYCSVQKVLRGYNDLETLYPSIALEWHPTKNGTLSPSDFTAKSNKKFWWKCPMCDHEWMANPNHRVYRHSGCPACSGRVSTPTENLSISNPELCKEWNKNRNSKKPSEYRPHSNQKVWWICSVCGYEWEAKISDRSNGTGCPMCAKKRTQK